MAVIHLRLVIPCAQRDEVVSFLCENVGVAHVAVAPNGAVQPVGDVVWCDVAREAANDVVEWLQRRGVHRDGAIAIELPDAVVSDAAALADRRAPGDGADALIWEQVEARVRAEAAPTISYLLFMAIASLLAMIGVLLDSPILIVGAMVVGPDYGPVAAVCVAVARRRNRRALAAAWSLAAGIGVGGVAAFVGALSFVATGIGPDYVLTDRELTAFISHPDGTALVVAILAGVVGMLSLTQSRGSVLVGVLVSVTTIPAVGNMGAAAAHAEWNEFVGAGLQLAINLVGLIVAGVVTLAAQHVLTNRRLPPTANR